MITMRAEETIHEHTPEEINLFRPVLTAYRRVFRVPPTVTPSRLPGGSPAILINKWLLIFPAGIGERWIIRTIDTRKRFKHLPCLSRPAEIEKGSQEAAIIHLCYLESHRLVHEAA